MLNRFLLNMTNASGSKVDLLEHVEAEQRCSVGDPAFEQSSESTANSLDSLYEGEFQSSDNGWEEDIQPQLLEASESMDFNVQEDKTTEQIRYASIKNAKGPFYYGNIIIFTIPRRESVTYYDEKGEACVQTTQDTEGRPIAVSLSSDPPKYRYNGRSKRK